MTQCKNCGELIDKFIGQDSKAIIYLHIIELEGMWGWVNKGATGCRKPEPK